MSKRAGTTRTASSRDSRASPRLLAVQLLVRVLRRELTFDRALAHDRAVPFVHELLYGVLRRYFSLSQQVSRHLEKPLRHKDLDLQCLLLTGALQILFMRTPERAAVHASVDIARQLGKPWAAKLINAVLRAIAREKREPEGLEARLDHPQWFIEAVRQGFPDHWHELLAANLTRAPMFLRVNLTKTTRDLAIETLQQALHPGVVALPGNLPTCITLSEPMPSVQIPSIAGGELSIQDQGAQLAATLIAPRAGMRILDACAAPGNKATHLLETAPGISLTCVDESASRLGRLQDECARLALPTPSIHCARLEDLAWWDGRAFDAVLLDVPCSGTGTLRRHPDIKPLIRPTDLEAHHQQQVRLLDAAWRTLKPGGRLLYSTCSMLKRENEDSVQSLARREDAELLDLPEIKAFGIAHIDTGFGTQLITTPQGPDAMFYAHLGKRHSSTP